MKTFVIIWCSGKEFKVKGQILYDSLFRIQIFDNKNKQVAEFRKRDVSGWIMEENYAQ